jgi:hypothetical protein
MQQRRSDLVAVELVADQDPSQGVAAPGTQPFELLRTSASRSFMASDFLGPDREPDEAPEVVAVLAW